MIVRQPHELVNDHLFIELPNIIDNSQFFLKLEGLNPAGSVKLKAAVSMVERVERRNMLSPGGRIIESSSGSLGVALAMVSAARNYQFTCVVDPNVSRQSLDAMCALGADVIQIESPDANGGYLSTRINTVNAELDRDPNLIWLNQYANPANPAAHEAGTATAILREIGQVDHLFVGVGTSGTLAGCSRHFRRFSPWTHIVAVDSVGSVTFGGNPGPRHIPGLGTSRRPELYTAAAADEQVLVPEAEAVRVCRYLARDHGLLVGGSTGSIVAAVLRMRENMPYGSRVVALSPDLGDRYVRTVYNDEWSMQKFGPDALLPLAHAEDSISIREA